MLYTLSILYIELQYSEKASNVNNLVLMEIFFFFVNIWGLELCSMQIYEKEVGKMQRISTFKSTVNGAM